jgi:hypothetical protein
MRGKIDPGSHEVLLRQLAVGNQPVVAGDYGQNCIHGIEIQVAPGPFFVAWDTKKGTFMF